MTDLASGSNPLLGVALEALPAVRKRLAKNPTALSVLLPMLMKTLNKGGGLKGNPGQPESNMQKRIKGGV
ncbi:unnamed protein product [marine sediment metagenome]|uniref:Uncharacterized protein n=1 Tax=marine sediment metagenome TaxID=412755 RepID=X1KB01_9ZZZZ